MKHWAGSGQSKNKFTAGNFADAIKAKLIAQKDPNKKDAEGDDKNLEEILKRIEDLEKAGSLTDEKLIEGAINAFSPQVGICVKEKERWIWVY